MMRLRMAVAVALALLLGIAPAGAAERPDLDLEPDGPCLAVIVSAHDRHLADSLPGAALAGTIDGVLFPVWGDEGPELAEAILTEGATETAVIVGGPGAVPERIAEGLRESGLRVVSLSGATRTDTAEQVRRYTADAMRRQVTSSSCHELSF